MIECEIKEMIKYALLSETHCNKTSLSRDLENFSSTFTPNRIVATAEE